MNRKMEKIYHEIYNAKAFLRVANNALQKYETWDEIGDIYALYVMIYDFLEEIEDSF